MSENKIGQILKDQYHNIKFISNFDKKVIKKIIVCRTELMGQRKEICDHCGHEITLYNSCRNRNCPTCQGKQSFKWLKKRLNEVLPVTYYHAVFTIPEELKKLFLYNKRNSYNILFKSAALTLTQVAERNLKIKLGFMSVLHTWDQKINFHPHVHCVIVGGGLQEDKWKSIINKNYLLPVKKLSRVFKGKMLFYLNKAFKKGYLNINKNAFLSICNQSSKKDWVVFIKKPMGGAQQVFKYLSRYTHKIGISNKRIVNYDEKNVTFTYRDRKNNNNEKQITIRADLFIKRFMLHILPKRFVKIRFYGFMANRYKKKLKSLYLKLTDNLTDIIDHLAVSLPFFNYRENNLCPKCKIGNMHPLVMIYNSG